MTEHTTHYEDCGCLSKRFAERIAELERDNRNMHSLNDGMRETVAELEANAEELMAEVKMYGAANGELKDALDEALTELAATMNALSAAHEALTSAESALSGVLAELATTKVTVFEQYEWERKTRAKLAALKARLEWLFDNFAEIASPTEDFDEWCAEIDTHITGGEARP